MNRCDFSSVMKLIREYIGGDEPPTQIELLYALFDEFMRSAYTIDYDFDEGQVCRWLKGASRVSPKIIKYYLDPAHKKSFINDIEINILPLMYDEDMAVKKLTELIMLDASISEKQKNKICNNKSNAETVANIICFTLERPFEKSSNKLALSGNASPMLHDYIMSDEVPRPCKHFCGRDDEIERIHSAFEDNTKIFLQGIAGIGKSETAKMYAKKHKNEYRNILYILYLGDLKNDIIGLDFVDDITGESEEERYAKHLRFLRTLNQDTLIIIDNFNSTADTEETLPQILKLRCRVLFTTRSIFEGECLIRLDDIKDRNILFNIVEKLYSNANKNREIVEQLINIVHSHTFAVELIARLLQNGILAPNELLNRLQDENVNLNSEDEIRINKDGSIHKETYYNHIHKLFEIYELSVSKQSIMCSLSMIPQTGIYSRVFAEWLKLSNMNDINDLIEAGFINSTASYKIFLHPMIKEIAIADLKPTVSKCQTMCESIQNICLIHNEANPHYKTIFGTVENIIRYAKNDNFNFYLRFIEDAFPYMESYMHLYGMKMIIKEMEMIFAENDVADRDKALLLDYKAACETNYEKMAKLEKQALATLKEITPDNAHLASNINANLGGIYREMGDYKQALDYMETAKDLLTEYVPKNSSDYIAQICNYAMMRIEMGDAESALSPLLELEKIVLENIGKISFENAHVQELLGYAYMMNGNKKETDKKLKEAVSIYIEIWAEETEVFENKMNDIKLFYNSLIRLYTK